MRTLLAGTRHSSWPTFDRCLPLKRRRYTSESRRGYAVVRVLVINALQIEAFRPFCNTPATALWSPQSPEVLPMCPVRSVTYVSGRSDGLVAKRLARFSLCATFARLFTVDHPQLHGHHSQTSIPALS